MESEILKTLQEKGYHVLYQEKTDSTNVWAGRLAREGAPSRTLVCADMQTDGRGRRGRRWESPPGESLYMTLILRPDFCPQQASMLTLVTGLSVAQALCAMTGLEALLKWPNDVVVSGKKICGILTEMSAGMERVEYILIGVGINVNGCEFPEELKAMATSVKLELGHAVSRWELAAMVWNCFEENYRLFQKTGNFSLLRQEYERMLVSRNRQVRVSGREEPFEGLAMGINDEGELLVKGPDGKIREICAGEVSVRGLYGYI